MEGKVFRAAGMAGWFIPAPAGLITRILLYFQARFTGNGAIIPIRTGYDVPLRG